MDNKHYNKIIITFVLLVFLPSLVMGLLALRGIKNDQALREKERETEYNKLSERITISCKHYFDKIENEFSDKIKNLVYKKGMTIDNLYPAISKSLPCLTVFSVDRENNTIVLPKKELLFLLNRERKREGFLLEFKKYSALEKKAQEYEFKEKSYKAALKIYRELLEKSMSRKKRGRFLLNIARLQKKSGQYSEALKSYKQSADELGDIYLRAGIPASLIAGLERVDILSRMGSQESALKLLCNLYQDLITPRWSMNESGYLFIHGKILSFFKIFIKHSNSAEWEQYGDQLEKLKQEEDKRLQQTKILLDFIRIGSIYFEEYSAASKRNQSIEQQKRAVLYGAEAKPFLILFMDDNTFLKNIWGIILDWKTCAYEIIPGIILKTIMNKDVSWVLRDQKEQIIAKSSDKELKETSFITSFNINFPQFKLDFYEKRASVFKTIFLTRHSLYFYIFVMIAFVLIFGIVFTFITLNHEMYLSKVKSDLTYVVSHEFKTPLTAIMQLSELLHRNRVKSNENKQHYYKVILEQSARLKLIIDNILDFSKLEYGRKIINFQMVNFDQFLSVIITRMQERVEHKGFQITADISTDLPYIRMDPMSFEQAIVNLIDNAIKYSDKNKIIKISAYSENNELVVAVKDYGVGIEKKEKSKIFNQFYRSRRLGKRFKGSGLGLTIAIQIVKEHNGTINIESNPGKGSTFFIRLPFIKMEGEEGNGG